MTVGGRSGGGAADAADGEEPRSDLDDEGADPGPAPRAPAGEDDEPADPEEPLNPA